MNDAPKIEFIRNKCDGNHRTIEYAKEKEQRGLELPTAGAYATGCAGAGTKTYRQ